MPSGSYCPKTANAVVACLRVIEGNLRVDSKKQFQTIAGYRDAVFRVHMNRLYPNLKCSVRRISKHSLKNRGVMYFEFPMRLQYPRTHAVFPVEAFDLICMFHF